MPETDNSHPHRLAIYDLAIAMWLCRNNNIHFSSVQFSSVQFSSVHIFNDFLNECFFNGNQYQYQFKGCAGVTSRSLISLKFDQIGFGSKVEAQILLHSQLSQYFIRFYFSREAAVQESLMAPFFGQKCPQHVVFEGL